MHGYKLNIYSNILEKTAYIAPFFQYTGKINRIPVFWNLLLIFGILNVIICSGGLR